MACANLRAAFGRHPRAVALRLDGEHLDRRQQPRTTTERCAQEAGGQPARVGGEIVVAEDRGAARYAEALVHLAGREKGDLQSGPAARIGFLAQRMLIQQIALQIEAVTLDAGRVDAEVPHARPQRLKRKAGAAPDTLRAFLANLFRQLRKRRIDFILQQRSRCRRRAGNRPAAIDDDHRQTGFAQCVGDHSAADARADHQHIRRKIAYQQLAWDRRQPVIARRICRFAAASDASPPLLFLRAAFSPRLVQPCRGKRSRSRAGKTSMFRVLKGSPLSAGRRNQIPRSPSILDLDAVGSGEAIIFCPANHSPPICVVPYSGTPGYEAVATCLAAPEVRARTAGVIAWRPHASEAWSGSRSSRGRKCGRRTAAISPIRCSP